MVAFGYSSILESNKPLGELSGKDKNRGDSVRLRTAKIRENKPFKPNFLFVNPKSSFYNKYLLSTLNRRNSFIRVDTTTYPLGSSLSNIQVSSPIHDAMTLSYSLLQENLVTAKLFSVLGNEVTTLFSEKQNSGYQSKTLNISDKVSSGIYILRITVGSQRIAKRIQVL